MPGKSGSHIKEPLSDIVYSFYTEENSSTSILLPSYLRLESLNEKNSSDSTSRLFALISNPHPEFILKNVKTKKLVVSVSMASELIWNTFVDENIRKGVRFYPKHDNLRNRSIGADGTHTGSIIKVHKKLNEFFDGIKKSFVETELYAYLAQLNFDDSVEDTIRKRFENFAAMNKLIEQNSIFEIYKGKLQTGNFRDVSISDAAYVKIWTYILYKECYCGSLKDDQSVVGYKKNPTKKDKIRRRLYDDRYAVVPVPPSMPTDILSLFSNFDPSRIIVDKRLHKIVLSDRMVAELTWMNAPPSDCRSKSAVFLFESFNHYFTGFLLTDVEKSLHEFLKVCVYVDMASNFEMTRRIYFSPKTSHSLVKLYEARKRLMDEFYDPNLHDFKIDDDALADRAASTNRWMCEANLQKENLDLIVYQNYVLRRDYRAILRTVHERFRARSGSLSESSSTAVVWRYGVYLLINGFFSKSETSIDERFNKIYRFMELIVDSTTTRANTWRMFMEIFSMNLSFGRTSDVERMRSMLTNQKLSGGKSNRKLIEVYFALLYYKIYCDERKEKRPKIVNSTTNVIRVTKTVETLMNFGQESIDLGRLTKICLQLLNTCDDDESVSSSDVEIEKILVDRLTEEPRDATALTTLVEKYPDNPLIESVIEQNPALPLVPGWCVHRILTDADPNLSLVFRLLFAHLDYNSNRNSKIAWKLLKKLLDFEEFRRKYRAELIKLWSSRSEFWEPFLLQWVGDEKNKLYKKKKRVIDLLTRFAGNE